MNDYYSNARSINCGVPQGTVIGPLLFNFFINDLLNININSIMEILSFADDTTILISEPTVDSLYHEANETLNNVYDWFCKNNLKLNLLRSKLICSDLSVNNVLHGHNLTVHSLRCNPILNTNCDLKCVKLEKDNELKYLILIIDYRLR